MKTATREDGSNSMDKISELPEGILQRILYFLSQEDAVRTSVFSKSWRYIWCTRPNLDFSDLTFKGKKHQFLSVVTNTLQRYCDQRLSLEEFHFTISLACYSERESVSLLEKWIPTLPNMGMKKKFCLSIRSEQGVELPPVVFGAESLQELILKGFKLDRNTVERIVLFKHLKTLRLQQVSFEAEIFQKIILNCPLIEILYVLGCTRLRTITVTDLHKLNNFYFSEDFRPFAGELCTIKINPPSLQTIDVSYGNIWFQKGAVFHNLKDLILCGVRSSLGHLSQCKFPSLKNLSFWYCNGLREIKIFIDAPNIEYFEYDGGFIPSISFATTNTSSKWNSDMNIRYRHSDDDASSWFLKLKELLESLNQSEISLKIYDNGMNGEGITIQENVNNGCSRPAAVESLSFLCEFTRNIPSFLYKRIVLDLSSGNNR